MLDQLAAVESHRASSAFARILVAGTAFPLVLVIVSVGLAVAAQLTLKTAMNSVVADADSGRWSPLHVLLRAAAFPGVWWGLALFGVSAVFWLLALSRIPLSFAYPLVGTSYVLLLGFAKVVLHEHVPLSAWIGAALISLGIGVIGIGMSSLLRS